MSIFKSILSKKPSPSVRYMMKALEEKPLYKYEMLEPFTIADIEEILSNQTAFGRCRLIAETEEYWFYGFTPQLSQFTSGEYVLRRSKTNTDQVQYFGESRELTCVYDKWLCQANHDSAGPWLGKPVIIKNIENGETNECRWFHPSEGFRGHFIQYDYINRMFIDDSHLVFDVGRYKGDFHNRDDSYDYTAEYYLVVEWKDGDFHTEERLPDSDAEKTLDLEVTGTRDSICEVEYNKAIGLFETGTKESAQRAYVIMHNLASEHEYIPAVMQMAFYQEDVKKDLVKANNWYKKAADLGDGDAAYIYAMNCLQGIGMARDYDLAVKYCQMALDEGVEDASVMMNVLITSDREEINNAPPATDLEPWRDIYGDIICPGDDCPWDCDDRCPVWLNTKGVNFIQMKECDIAIQRFKKAVSIAPDFAEAYNNLGTAYGMTNQHREAYNAFSEALKLQKEYPKALWDLIVSEKNLGMFEEALKHCDEYDAFPGCDSRLLREAIDNAGFKNTFYR